MIHMEIHSLKSFQLLNEEFILGKIIQVFLKFLFSILFSCQQANTVKKYKVYIYFSIASLDGYCSLEQTNCILFTFSRVVIRSI